MAHVSGVSYESTGQKLNSYCLERFDADRLDLIEMSLSNTGTVLITKKLQPHLKLSLLPAVCWVRERPGTIVKSNKKGGKLRAIRGPQEISRKIQRFEDQDHRSV